jgi:CheY-like chemotaxis protein
MVEAGKNGHPDARPSAADTSEVSPQLLRSLVHELRNPLAPLRNAAELLRTLCDDPRQLQAVDIMSRQLGSLTRALEDLTGAMEGRQTQVRLNKQLVDVADIVEPALQAVRPAVDGLRQNLLVSLPNEPVEMYCDTLRLDQVIQTLLENATQHTPAGGSIALRVARNEGELVIEVRDDGAGIAAEKLQDLFNVFGQQLPGADGKEPAGLSLAISRQVIEMHGGTIEAFSDGVGRGSEFVVRLPIVIEPPGSSSSVPAEIKNARKVIIIEDQEDTISGLRDVLASGGHAVLAANTGELGLALAEKFKPDAVIIDIGLPGMDGFEVAARLRASKATAGAVLVAVSGFSLKQFKDLSAYSVFRHYLIKPTNPGTILAIIDGIQEPGRKRPR